MRIYKNFPEAMSEIKRDVVEMGIKAHPKTYQDKYIGNDAGFETMELQNYIYTVVNPVKEELNPNQPWADAEWLERLQGMNGKIVNPGQAWKLRKEVWEEFLDEKGKFAYTYGERFCLCDQVQNIIDRIKVDPESRQLFITVWNPSDSYKLGGVSRVPCSLGYQIQIRKGGLNLTYLQRSADVVTHFTNDVYLAFRMQEHIAGCTGYKIGTYTHWIGSLHTFKKDSQGVF